MVCYTLVEKKKEVIKNFVKNRTTQLSKRRSAFSGTEALEKFPEPRKIDIVCDALKAVFLNSSCDKLNQY